MKLADLSMRLRPLKSSPLSIFGERCFSAAGFLRQELAFREPHQRTSHTLTMDDIPQLSKPTSIKVFDHHPEDFDKYDVCLEFPVDSSTNKLNAIAAEVLDRIIAIVGSKYVYLFYSQDTSIIFALIRTALKLVKNQAESDGYKLLLDGERTKERAFDGDDEALVDGFAIPHIPEVSKLEPFEFIYGEYVLRPDAQDLYYRPEGMTHPFHKVVRIKLLSRMLRSNKAISKDCDLGLEFLMLGNVIKDFYPVHDQYILDDLKDGWFAAFSVPWRQPFMKIRDYFGEKMGYFFVFLGFLSYSFLYPALIGVAFEVMAIYYDNYNRPELAAFAFFIPIWAITLVRFWQRVQKSTALKWNMLGVSQHIAEREEVRYEFYGMDVKSAIDGRDTVYFSASKRSGLYFVSAFFVLLTMAICLGTVAALFYVRSLVRQSDAVSDYDQWITPAMLSLQITIANRVIYAIAAVLTRWENHRLEEEFDYAITGKLFLMQFVNASSSFYYLAFAAKYVPDKDVFIRLGHAVHGCGPDDCVTTLTVHILVILGTQMLGSVVVNFWLPYIARAIYNFRCDIHSWYVACGMCLGDFYALYMVAATFCLNTSIGECCLSAYNCWYTCCCGPPLPKAVPLVRTNIGQVDRSGMMDRSLQPNSEAITLGTDYAGDDDISDLENDDAYTQHEESKLDHHDNTATGKDARSPPPPLRSMAELRIGLSNLAVHQKKTGALASTGGSMPHSGGNIGASADAPISTGHIDLDSVDLPMDATFTRIYKFDQDHQLRRAYGRIIMLVALTLCFGTLLPGVFAAALLMLYFEVRGRAWQLLEIYKRTFPYEVEDIGQCWNRILHAVVTLTVLTNAALISFSMKQFAHWDWAYKLALFIGIVLGLRAYKAVLDTRLADTPPEVITQQKRAHFISQKLIRKVADRTDDFAVDML